MPDKTKTLRIGVLLDDDEKLRGVLSHAENIDYLIEPRDVDQLLDYLAKLGREGHKVDTLLLTGHGRQKQHKIGKLEPDDMNLDKINRRREASYGNRLDALKALRRVTAKRSNCKQPETREQLDEELLDLQDALSAADTEYETTTRRQRAYHDIQQLMTPGATVGLLNCYADADPQGRRFIENIGKALLDKHGGRVIANTDLILVAKIQPLLAWITGQDDHLLLPLGEWTSHEQPGGGQSGSLCGAPCGDFKRYGFCDHRVGKDGGPCFQHR